MHRTKTFQTFGSEFSFPYSCFAMTKGESLCPEFVAKFASLTSNLKIEAFDDASSSSEDSDFTSKIDLESDSEDESSAQSELPQDQ
jgi:hypothetical protein